MGGLLEQIDAYCERMDPGYWAEPVNALTNLAFIISAAIMWPVSRPEPYARALCLILFAIGIGSFLFHTHAQVWSAIADTLPILLFILVYIQAVNQHLWLLRPWPALALTMGFIPYAMVTIPWWEQVPVFGVSAAYMPVPTLIVIYAVLLYRRAPRAAQGLFFGAGLLIASLFARSVDERWCNAIPIGTHFLWHILNAIMLGWMISVYLRHRRRHANA